MISYIIYPTHPSLRSMKKWLVYRSHRPPLPHQTSNNRIVKTKILPQHNDMPNWNWHPKDIVLYSWGLPYTFITIARRRMPPLPPPRWAPTTITILDPTTTTSTTATILIIIPSREAPVEWHDCHHHLFAAAVVLTMIVVARVKIVVAIRLLVLLITHHPRSCRWTTPRVKYHLVRLTPYDATIFTCFPMRPPAILYSNYHVILSWTCPRLPFY